MAPVAASADAAVMEERISAGLSLPFTVTPTPSPQQTPETKLPAHQPSLRNVCIVCCCETTREDEPCLLRWRGLIMREIRDGGDACVSTYAPLSGSTTPRVPVRVCLPSCGDGVPGQRGARTGHSETGACGGCSAACLCVLQRLWGACLTFAISEDVSSRSICEGKTVSYSTVQKGFTHKVLSFFLRFLYPQQYISRVIE